MHTNSWSTEETSSTGRHMKLHLNLLYIKFNGLGEHIYGAKIVIGTNRFYLKLPFS